jgi:hypothetical protein
MATDKVSPTLFKPQVNTGTEGSPTWTDVKGLNEVSFDVSSESVDATDFDSPGWTQDRIVSRGKTMSWTGFYLVDPDTGDRDPGQEAVEAAADTITGESGHVLQYRLEKAWGGAITFKATVEVKAGGGEAKGLSPWEATLSITEKPVES